MFKLVVQTDNRLFVSERKRLVVTDFISEINHKENKSDLKKLPCVNEHGLQDFYLKISKMIQGRRTLLVIFCIISESEAFETTAEINEGPKRM